MNIDANTVGIFSILATAFSILIAMIVGFVSLFSKISDEIKEVKVDIRELRSEIRSLIELHVKTSQGIEENRERIADLRGRTEIISSMFLPNSFQSKNSNFSNLERDEQQDDQEPEDKRKIA